MSDLTRIAFEPGGDTRLLYPGPGKPLSEFLGLDELVIEFTAPELAGRVDGTGRLDVTPGFAMREDEFAQRTLKNLSPLIERGRVIVEGSDEIAGGIAERAQK